MAINSVLLTNTFAEFVTITNSVISQINDIGLAGAVTLTGGNIDGVAIGTSTPSTAIITALTVSSSITLTGASIIMDNNAISGNKISGGTIDSVVVELSNTPTNVAHATRKDYVDSQNDVVRDEAINLALLMS